MHLVLGLGRLLPLLLDLSSARGVGVSLDFSSVASERAPSSPSPSGAGEAEVARLQRTPLTRAAASVVSPIPRRTFDDVRNRGRLRSLAPACYPLVVPDLRIEEHGRIRELDCSRVAPVDVAVVLALTPLPVHSQEVESVDVGHRHGRSLLVFGHAVTSRGLVTATALGLEALVLGETGLDTGLDPRIDTGLDPRIDTGLTGTALGVTGRCLLTATDHVVSVRVPLPAGEVGVTSCGHPISRVALVRSTTLLS